MSDGREAFESVGREDKSGNALDAGLIVEGINIAVGDINLGQANTLVNESIWLESNAFAAIVMSLATAGNINTLTDAFAVSLAGSAETSASSAIVESGASSWNVVALVSDSTPRGSIDESQTVSTIVMSETT